jgi:creatinine amidohydrolase
VGSEAMKWANLTTGDLDALSRDTPVILNIAAIEQHGPHLPVDTDLRIGGFFLDQLDQEMPDAQLILPPVCVGCSDHHLDFTGTLSIPHQVFQDYVIAILESVAKSGFRNIILFNSHGGNIGIGQVITERFGADHPECQIVFATWWNLVREELLALSGTDKFGTGHACELETSLMMACRPQRNYSDLPGGESFVSKFSWADGSMLYPAKVTLYRSMKAISGGNGVVGKPQAGTIEKGQEILDLVVKTLSQIVKDLRG